MSIVESVVRRRPEIIRGFLQSFNPPELPLEEPRTIVIAGIGSSAAGGLFLETYSVYPTIISRDISLPPFVTDKDLVIISSYSGNTAETLMSLRDALNRGIKPVVITSGGKLLEVASDLGLPIIELKPKGYTSRAVVALIITATLALVAEIDKSLRDYLDGIPLAIETAMRDEENIQEIALRIGGRAIVSVGYGPYKPGMKRIIAEFAENSKQPAFYIELPEGNHNYLVTLGHPGVVHLYPEHQRRESLARRTGRLNEKEHIPIRVLDRGFLGNFEILTKAALASIRLARILGRDPDDISRIDRMKEKLLKGLDKLFK